MAKKSNLSVRAMEMYQNIDGYGKLADANTITVDVGLESATITAIGANKQINGGDIVYIYPVLVSGDGATGVATETLIFDVTHYVSKKYFQTETITVAFSTTAVADINTALTTAGLNTKVKAELVGTKLRLQTLQSDVGVVITGGTGLASLQLAVDDATRPLIFKVTANATAVATTLQLSEFYLYGVSKFDTVASLTGLAYTVKRFLGQSTGGTLTATLTEDTYKGASKVGIQTEYSEGESTLTANDLVFNRENLEYLKGFRKRTVGRTHFSGEPCSVTYKMGSYSDPVEFSLLGLSPKSDGVGLLHIEADRVKAPSFMIPMGKEFRVNSETMQLMANTDRVVCKIYEV